MSGRRLYTKFDDDFIVANIGKIPIREIGRLLGRGEGSISDRACKLGVRAWKSRPFSPEEDDVIRNGWSRSSTDVAEELGRDAAVVRARAKRIGLDQWKHPEPGKYADTNRGYRVRGIVKGTTRRLTEHRAVMADHIGRAIGDNERVHHINCDKSDNRIENLHLFPSGTDHSRAHWSINAIMPALISRGIVRFNRETGLYELCDGGQ